NGVSITAAVGGGLIAGSLRPYEVEVDKNVGNRYSCAMICPTAPCSPAGFPATV
ncbi:MAG: hypothetical protein IPI66_15475, partial [Chitinophagaceae bacterium]|nr:hypothetical protein [Chitinophagaceae bacterium]